MPLCGPLQSCRWLRWPVLRCAPAPVPLPQPCLSVSHTRDTLKLLGPRPSRKARCKLVWERRSPIPWEGSRCRSPQQQREIQTEAWSSLLCPPRVFTATFFSFTLSVSSLPVFVPVFGFRYDFFLAALCCECTSRALRARGERSGAPGLGQLPVSAVSAASSGPPAPSQDRQSAAKLPVHVHSVHLVMGSRLCCTCDHTPLQPPGPRKPRWQPPRPLLCPILQSPVGGAAPAELTGASTP